MASGVSTAVVGSIINAPGFVPPGTEIANISGANITMTQLALQSSGGSSTSFTVTGPNGGTMIQDAGGACFYKTDYRGDPHEWGAVGDNNNDDTIPLQNWMGAYGMVLKTLPSGYNSPANYGPFVASLPAQYLISGPLVCPENANILAPSNLSVPTGGSPPVSITATSGFTDTDGIGALMLANDFCRISGLSLNASNVGANYQSLSGQVDATNANQIDFPIGTIFSGFVVPGVPLIEPGTNGCLAQGAVVTQVNAMATPPNVIINSLGTLSCSDTFALTGFHALDLLGTHNTIDSHTELTGGFYDVFCKGPNAAGLQVKDVEIVAAADDGLHLSSCSNIRLIDDLISGNGVGTISSLTGNGRGVSANGSDITITGGVIEQSGGIGLDIENGQQMSISNTYFDNNGKQLGGSAVKIANSNTISLCGSHFHRSGGDVSGSSHILFAGVTDSVNICGNVYLAGADGNHDPTLKPWYDYDVASGTEITNTHIYETATPQMAGVFSPAAATLIGNLQVPQITQSQFNGLTLSNDVAYPNSIVDIATGQAADSTNSAILNLAAPGCDVNFHTNGAGGLDAPSFATNKTYFIYVIGSPGQSQSSPVAPATSCMASLSAVAPAFSNTYFSPSGYVADITGWVVGSSSQTIINVSSNAGLLPGQPITGSLIASGSVISSISPGSVNSITFTWLTSTTFSSSATLSLGELVYDSTGCLQAGTYISNISGSGPYTYTISHMDSCTPMAVSVSNGITITMNQNGTGSSTTPSNLVVSTGLYRMVGQVLSHTVSSLPALRPFSQIGDTYYFQAPFIDINTSTLGSATSFALTVPQGIVVEALGRCVGGGSGGATDILLYTPTTTPGTPAAFPTVPGYSVNQTTANTSFPYRLHTNTSAQITAAAASSGTTLQCMTDGWVWRPY
jgi:hypothetical protein